MLTTTTAAAAAVRAIQAMRQHGWSVAAMQDYKRLMEGGVLVEASPQPPVGAV
jgi:hypothetical protein